VCPLPGAATPAGRRSGPALASPIRFGQAGIRIGFFLGGRARGEVTPRYEEPLKVACAPGLARLLSALAASSFLLGTGFRLLPLGRCCDYFGRVPELLPPLLEAPGEFEIAAARTCSYPFLPEDLRMLVVLDACPMIFATVCSLNGLAPNTRGSAGENTPIRACSHSVSVFVRLNPVSSAGPRCLASGDGDGVPAFPTGSASSRVRPRYRASGEGLLCLKASSEYAEVTEMFSSP